MQPHNLSNFTLFSDTLTPTKLFTDLHLSETITLLQIPLYILYNQKQFMLSTYQKADDNAIVKTRKKGFREIAKFGKSLGIPYFKPISVLFYLLRVNNNE